VEQKVLHRFLREQQKYSASSPTKYLWVKMPSSGYES